MLNNGREGCIQVRYSQGKICQVFFCATEPRQCLIVESPELPSGYFTVLMVRELSIIQEILQPSFAPSETNLGIQVQNMIASATFLWHLAGLEISQTILVEGHQAKVGSKKLISRAYKNICAKVF